MSKQEARLPEKVQAAFDNVANAASGLGAYDDYYYGGAAIQRAAEKEFAEALTALLTAILAALDEARDEALDAALSESIMSDADIAQAHANTARREFTQGYVAGRQETSRRIAALKSKRGA